MKRLFLKDREIQQSRKYKKTWIKQHMEAKIQEHLRKNSVYVRRWKDKVEIVIRIPKYIYIPKNARIYLFFVVKILECRVTQTYPNSILTHNVRVNCALLYFSFCFTYTGFNVGSKNYRQLELETKWDILTNRAVCPPALRLPALQNQQGGVMGRELGPESGGLSA